MLFVVCAIVVIEVCEDEKVDFSFAPLSFQTLFYIKRVILCSRAAKLLSVRVFGH